MKPIFMASQSAHAYGEVRVPGRSPSQETVTLPRNHTDEIATRLSRWPDRVDLMCTKYDPQHEAEAAMKRAAASEGVDRQRLIQLALAWQELARDRRDERTD